jgi:hypothetical protein
MTNTLIGNLSAGLKALCGAASDAPAAATISRFVEDFAAKAVDKIAELGTADGTPATFSALCDAIKQAAADTGWTFTVTDAFITVFCANTVALATGMQLFAGPDGQAVLDVPPLGVAP